MRRCWAGSSQIGFIRFFEPFKHLRCGDRPFRQMGIERARADIWRVDQFRSREFLGLSLVRKCFGRPCVRSLPISRLLSSNETYHVPLDLLAMIPSRATPAARRRGQDLNRRLTKSFRLPPAGPQDSFSAVAGVQWPSRRINSVVGIIDGDRRCSSITN
jgi:hypothetical protein